MSEDEEGQGSIMDDKSLISQLPVGAKARLYASGIIAFMPPWLFSSLAMLAVFVHAEGHWARPEGFASVDHVGLAVGALMASLFALLGTMARLLIDASRPSFVHGRRTVTLALAAACAWTLAGPWPYVGASTVDKASFESAYAQDVAAMRAAASGAVGGSGAAAAMIWQKGAVARASGGFEESWGRMMSDARGVGMDWPTREMAGLFVQKLNFKNVSIGGMLLMLEFIVLDAALGPLAMLMAALARRLSRAFRAPSRGKSGRGSGAGWKGWAAVAARSLFAGLKAAWGLILGSAAAAKRGVESAALSDPQRRAEFEKSAIEAASGPAISGSEGAPRL